MLDEFDSPTPQEIKGLNLIPIVDMFTTIIFFLQMTVTFYSFSSHTLPPAMLAPSVSSEQVQKTPLNLRVLAKRVGEGRYRLAFVWQGESPASESIDLELPPPTDRARLKELVETLRTRTDEVKKKIGTTEQTIRFSMEREVPLQVLVTLMDALKDSFPDVVLSSWAEAEQGGGA